MNCFICEKTKEEIVLLRLPLETIYDRVILEIIGNSVKGEYICLGCMGFQFDEVIAYKEEQPKCGTTV